MNIYVPAAKRSLLHMEIAAENTAAMTATSGQDLEENDGSGFEYEICADREGSSFLF